MAPSVCLLACTVMLFAMLLSSLSRASSSKMANELLLHVCCWWIGCKSWMFAGALGSCNVVGIQIGVLVGGGAIEHALACVTLSDGPSVGTLGSGVVGDRGRSSLSDGVSVAIGFDVPWWRTGRRISRRFQMACVCATEALVEVGTVLPRAMRVSVASSIMRSVNDNVGTVQSIGNRHHVSATRYCLVPGI